ncbi:MAG: ribosomal RNA small subunit methyltransferase A [Crenarchaeota archaeon]|nr:ribosomal RNA small subunit methyltransferase A [Thermoproteota archaeon]
MIGNVRSIIESLDVDKLSRRKLIIIVKRLTKKYNIKLRKRYGQHFLIDPAAIRRIVDQLRGCDKVLEIGPGLGLLTYIISHVSRLVIGVEIDRSFMRILKDICYYRNNIDVVIADALKFKIPRSFQVFSNLPFYITSDIIVKFVREEVPKALITVQKEVANRLVASPGSSDYGRLSVLVQCFYNVRKVFVMSRLSFYPPPEVDACLVLLERKSEPCISISSLEAFEKVTSLLFSFRNKNVEKVLRNYLNIHVPDDLRGKRVFELSVDDIVSIVKLVVSCVE